MLFNSLAFLLFLPLVFLLYWKVFGRKLRAQNIFLVVASYVFYAWWDWRFLSLIIISTGVDFLAGIMLGKERTTRRGLWLGLSLLVNLGILGFFKYFNFFVDSFTAAFHLESSAWAASLNIVLPVGISFYTFQTLSYTLDIYRGRLRPCHDLAAFAAYVAFFPQLVAGPIERASRLLPQMLKARHFSAELARKGVRLMLWGFVKKIVIADSLAPIVNEIFSSYQDQGSAALVLGIVLFSFQIYGDFSGYSDIARGLARLLGFELMLNFNFPYFARDIGEFWRKWHISLSTWFRDYLYIPLGGSRAGRARSIRNVAIIFLVSGLWHGANWTFVAWGAYHALLFVPAFLLGRNRRNLDSLQPGRYRLPRPGEAIRILALFSLVSFGWIFFRSPSILEALEYIQGIFSFRPAAVTLLNPYDNQPFIREIIALGLFIIVEFLLYTGQIRLPVSGEGKLKLLPALLDAALLVLILLHIPLSEQLSFIYFQF